MGAVVKCGIKSFSLCKYGAKNNNDNAQNTSCFLPSNEVEKEEVTNNRTNNAAN
jgi:hypothetical protein